MPPSNGRLGVAPAVITGDTITPTFSAPRNSLKSFQCPMSDMRPMMLAALALSKTVKMSVNIAVELAPLVFSPASLASFHSWKIRLTFGDVQSRLPAIQLSYSAGVSTPEPSAESQNWMPTPSLLPRAKHAVPVAFLMAAQSLRNALHVVGGLSASRPAFLYRALL